MQVVYAHSVLEPAISNLSFALVACILVLRHVASVSCALFGSNRTRRSTLRLRRLICCALEVEPIYHSLNATRTRALHSPPLSSRLARLVICSSPLIPFTSASLSIALFCFYMICVIVSLVDSGTKHCQQQLRVETEVRNLSTNIEKSTVSFALLIWNECSSQSLLICNCWMINAAYASHFAKCCFPVCVGRMRSVGNSISQ